jgi:cytochrome c oxidase subunit II
VRLPALAAIVVLLGAAAGCGGEETKSPEPEDVQGSVAEQTVAEGDAAAGKEVFASAEPGCGTCHTFKAAGANGQVGPNLDESLQGKDAEYIRESIVNPNADIAEGFSAGVMPKDYGTKLSDKQLADLVAFLQKG